MYIINISKIAFLQLQMHLCKYAVMQWCKYDVKSTKKIWYNYNSYNECVNLTEFDGKKYHENTVHNRKKKHFHRCDNLFITYSLPLCYFAFSNKQRWFHQHCCALRAAHCKNKFLSCSLKFITYLPKVKKTNQVIKDFPIHSFFDQTLPTSIPSGCTHCFCTRKADMQMAS